MSHGVVPSLSPRRRQRSPRARHTCPVTATTGTPRPGLPGPTAVTSSSRLTGRMVATPAPRKGRPRSLHSHDSMPHSGFKKKTFKDANPLYRILETNIEMLKT